MFNIVYFVRQANVLVTGHGPWIHNWICMYVMYV
jgi:hypothetical protein